MVGQPMRSRSELKSPKVGLATGTGVLGAAPPLDCWNWFSGLKLERRAAEERRLTTCAM